MPLGLVPASREKMNMPSKDIESNLTGLTLRDKGSPSPCFGSPKTTCSGYRFPWTIVCQAWPLAEPRGGRPSSSFCDIGHTVDRLDGPGL